VHLTSIEDELIDWQYKGFPPGNGDVTIGTVGDQGWNALSGDLVFPIMVIKEGVLDNNIALMARYCRERGVSLAPHAKTPLAPQIVKRQVDAGAWGVTVATLHQVRVFRAFGVSRFLVANELLQPVALRWLATELKREPELEVLVFVDSVAAVSSMSAGLGELSPNRPLRVLVELGILGGRAGARTLEEAISIAGAVRRSPHLQLAGVAGYEGVISGGTPNEQFARVDDFLLHIRTLLSELSRQNLLDKANEIIVSAGGSIFFDRVVAQLSAPWDLPQPVRVILRSGSYVTQDSDTYDKLSPLAGRGGNQQRLEPALELWGMVLSRPESGLAIVNFGKRDTSYDLGFPIPLEVRRGEKRWPAVGDMTVTALNDQHAYVHLDPGLDVAVGDLLGCGISHPCTAFDKWRLLPLVDDDYQVTGAIRTFF